MFGMPNRQFMGSYGQGFAGGLESGQRLSKNILDMIEKYQAGQAFKEGAEQRSTNVASGEEALRNFRANYAPQSEGAPQTADEYIAANPKVLEELQDRKASKEYSVGRGDDYKTQGTEFTPTQRRASGLQSLANYHYGQGNVEKGSDAEAKGMALETGAMALEEKRRAAGIQKLLDARAKLWRDDPKGMALKLYDANVGRYNDGLKGNIQELSNGNMAVWATDPKTGEEAEGTAKIVPKGDWGKEIARLRLTDMLAVDPSNLQMQMEAEKLGISREQVDAVREHYRSQADIGKGKLTEDTRSNKARENQATADALQRGKEHDQTFKAMMKQYGNVNDNAERMFELAKRNVVVAEQAGGDVHDKAVIAAKDALEYKTDIKLLDDALEKGDTEGAMKIRNRMSYNQAAKESAKSIIERHTDGSSTTRLAFAHDEKMSPAFSLIGDRETEKLNEKYTGSQPPQVDIDAQNGKRVYRTADMPKGKGYPTEEQLVKAKKLKLRTAANPYKRADVVSGPQAGSFGERLGQIAGNVTNAASNAVTGPRTYANPNPLIEGLASGANQIGLLANPAAADDDYDYSVTPEGLAKGYARARRQ